MNIHEKAYVAAHWHLTRAVQEERRRMFCIGNPMNAAWHAMKKYCPKPRGG